MLSNFIKKIADKDYLLFAECSFNFISGGEQNCKVKIKTYDTNGSFMEEVSLDKIENDIHFLLYGGYMFSWLAQIIETGININRNWDNFYEKWSPMLSPLFNIKLILDDNKKAVKDLEDYSLENILSNFRRNTKNIVIEKNSMVQFKINKIHRNLLVRVVNLPISEDLEGQIYLFVILYDFFVKNYYNAHKILGYGCDILMNVSINRPFPLIANKIIETMIEDYSPDIDVKNLSTKVLDKIY